MNGARHERGELAIVLHTHMPYVEGFGTWPFGEEWLWEAIATSYIPLLDVLGRAPITLSLTPVLCDQLEAEGTIERCLRFLTELRPWTHGQDREESMRRGERQVAEALEVSAADYAKAAEKLSALPSGLMHALGEHAGWTSAATHAVLPLLASDAAASLQVQTGIASHRRRFGAWNGGFWLPECAHAPWLDPVLEEAGARLTCVEFPPGSGVDIHHPLATEAGPVLWPLDREVVSLVWSPQGYPRGPAYRDSHRLTEHHHRPWRNDGAPYERAAAAELAAADARDFVSRVRERVSPGGVCVCALDTELLGHWWHEGVQWLAAVIEECVRQQLPLTRLDDALERHEPVPAPPELAVSTWGEGNDLRTWSAPGVADLAWQARTAELRLLARRAHPSERALRELLALQSSDWAFMAYRGLAADYPRRRAVAHAQTLERALGDDADLEATLRNLAPELVGWTG